MEKTESLFKIISRYDHYIEIANNKANYILASIISLNVAIAALLGYADILKFQMETPISDILKVLSIFAYFCFLFFTLQILIGVHKVIFPNTSSPQTPKSSNIFFGAVASRTHTEYADSIKKLEAEEFQEDLAFQANALAKIVDEKFKHQKSVMEIASNQFIISALAISILCGIIKALS